MLQQKFYWGTIRKAIVAFGNMFNNIHIDRHDADHNVKQTIRVPLSYASKQSFLARIDQVPGPAENRTVSVVVPRMAFEIIAINYDESRKLALVQKNTVTAIDNKTRKNQFVPTLYDINLNLYVYVKNMDDGLQIIEQILPYFNPDFNLTIKAMPDLEITNDLPIILNNINMEDTYEGDFTTRQSIIWTLQFTLKVNFFGPINKQGVITNSTINVLDSDTLGTYGSLESTEFVTTFEGFE